MPTDHSRKQHVRRQQRPGESYTAALRRLTTEPAAKVAWELDGGGLGSTEYTGTVAGRDLTVIFQGDHKRPWTGWWDVCATADLDEGTVLAQGRHRFTAAIPSDEDVAAALDHIGTLVAQIFDGQTPETVSTDHGAALGPADLVDAGTYFLTLDDDRWTVAELADLTSPDDAAPSWRIFCDDTIPAQDLFWQPADDGDGAAAGRWVDQDGRPVGVHAL